MSSPSIAKILIVDDHPVVRQGLALSLTANVAFAVCGEAGSIREALKLFEEHRPDLVLADLDLEDGTGLELIKRIRDLDSQAKVLVLSMHDENMYAERALRAGARGYVMKNSPLPQLLAALQTIADGKIAVSEKIAARILERVANRKGEAGGNSIDALTDREMQVFQMVGQGESTRVIAEKLSVSVKTVEAHLAHIKQKLGLNSGTELQHQAYQWASGKVPKKPILRVG